GALWPAGPGVGTVGPGVGAGSAPSSARWSCCSSGIDWLRATPSTIPASGVGAGCSRRVGRRDAHDDDGDVVVAARLHRQGEEMANRLLVARLHHAIDLLVVQHVGQAVAADEPTRGDRQVPSTDVRRDPGKGGSTAEALGDDAAARSRWNIIDAELLEATPDMPLDPVCADHGVLDSPAQV